MAHRLRERREERNRRGREGEGEGEWKQRQPFYKAAWTQAEMLSQECKLRICVHWAESRRRMQPWLTSSQQCNSGSDSDCDFDVICTLQSSILQAASSYGCCTHYPPSPSFFFPLFFITPSVITVRSPWAALKQAPHIMEMLSMCVCASVYSPAWSRSLSLCEAPVIVGGLLLWREQKMQHESYVSLQQQHDVSEV